MITAFELSHEDLLNAVELLAGALVRLKEHPEELRKIPDDSGLIIITILQIVTTSNKEKKMDLEEAQEVLERIMKETPR